MLKNINKRASLGKKIENPENDYIDMSKNYCEISPQEVPPFQPHPTIHPSVRPPLIYPSPPQQQEQTIINPAKRKYFDELMTQKQYHTGEIARINTEIYAKFGIPPM